MKHNKQQKVLLQYCYVKNTCMGVTVLAFKWTRTTLLSVTTLCMTYQRIIRLFEKKKTRRTLHVWFSVDHYYLLKNVNVNDFILSSADYRHSYILRCVTIFLHTQIINQSLLCYTVKLDEQQRAPDIRQCLVL